MPIGPDTNRQGVTRSDRGIPFIRDTGTPVSEPVDWFRYPYETISAAEASDPDLRDADDLGDLVDPQNDTYEEEGTHGILLGATAAVKAYGKLRTNPKTAPVVKAGEQALKSAAVTAAGKVVDYTKDKIAERKGVTGDDPLA